MRISNILIVILIFTLFSCNPVNKNSNTDIPYTESTDESDALDSAITFAQQHIDQKNFSYEFEMTVDGGHKIKTKITTGPFFGDKKYVIIKRASPIWNGITSNHIHAINVLLLKPKQEIKSLAVQAENLENFVNDTIQDVNGDGKKDFIGNYRSSLFGVKSRYTIVDLLVNDSTFANQSYVFTNASFSVEEKTIRGVLHGESGRTEIYKYRWNGIEIDTIEYIYHDSGAKGQFIKSKYLPQDKRNNEKEEVKLKSLPQEYLNLPELKWFMGDDK